MKKAKFHKYIILIILLVQGFNLFAQKEANIWYFGDSAGLNFNTNPPTALTNSVMKTVEGCSSIADKNGDLLFYSDGSTIWNKNHQIMDNGTGLLGHQSSTHSSLVIKHPGIDSLYFIFTSGEFSKNSGVCYSIIDMKLSGQLGAVTTKNVKLVNFSTEKIAAISHANLRDIWIAIPAYGSDSIYTFLITSTGVNLNAVKNRTGQVLKDQCVGQIKFSNDGTKLAFATYYDLYNAVVLDFDNSTGFLSNARIISGFLSYGLEFSPNSQYLYIGAYVNLIYYLYQCFIPNTSTNFSSVCNVIDSFSTLSQLQIAPDKHIYIESKFGKNYLNRINYPDNYFTNCGYFPNAVNLKKGKSSWGFPSFYQTFFSPIGFITSHFNCLEESVSVSIRIDTTIIDSINWYIGDTIVPFIHGTKIKEFKYINTYTLSKVIFAKVYSSSGVQRYYDSLITRPNPVLNLIADTSICIGDSIILKATYPGASYLWQDANTDSIYKVKTAGLYKVTSTLNGCSVIDSTQVSIKNLPPINLGNDTTICNTTTLLLTAPPNYESYLWNDSSKFNTLLVNNEGMYFVAVTDSGCVAEDDIKIYYLKTPNVYLGNDSTICDGVSFYLKASNTKANYLWSNSSTDSMIKVNQSGIYWVKAYNVCGTDFDTTVIQIEACDCYLYIPNAFTPNANNLNDVFLPVSNCKITNYHLIIFNRWGVQLFESNNSNIGWNGMFNEHALTNDVYGYQIEADLVDTNKATTKKSVTIKGNVTLVN